MNATNLVERRCRCDILNSRVTQNLERTQGILCGVISQRDAQGQHEPAVNHTINRRDRSLGKKVVLM